MAPLLHYYRAAALHEDPALQKKAASLGISALGSEVCFNCEAGAALSEEQQQRLEFLLRETFEPQQTGTQSMLRAAGAGQSVVEVGPRQQFTSAWSTNAVSICAAMGLPSVTRIEQSRRYLVRAAPDASPAALTQFTALVHDRMTECPYPGGIQSFAAPAKAEPWGRVPVMARGRKALEELSAEKGLGYDEQDLDYYMRIFREELCRDPTTVECFDLAQGNSEHSRHWFFGGQPVIDGEPMPKTLFELVKQPFKARPGNSTIAFKDNSSALRGFQLTGLFPVPAAGAGAAAPGPFGEVKRDYDITLTVETHNFPCGIAPFPGAETGAGGRIRDGESTGQGSLVVAAIAAYAVGNLHIPDYPLPWEGKSFDYPPNMAPPLQILIDASNGASDYGNKFGEPLICGWARTFGQRRPATGERIEWVKPIMLSGGIGQMDHSHINKAEPKKGQLIVKLGGPAYRIGVGGGAASSMVAGDNAAELDFNAVQRGDAEMLQKVNRVVRACVELGPNNPILSIHDQGAGGSGNVLKEIAEPAGAEIDIRKMLVGDPSMSVLELWTAEFQENNALLIEPEHEQLFGEICRRERAPYSVVGTVTGDGKVVVRDSQDGSMPVDLPLDKVLGKMPQKKFPMKRIAASPEVLVLPKDLTVEGALALGVLRLVSVGSKRFLTNKVDRSVTGLIAQQQCVGPLHTPLANVAVIAQSPLGVSGGATAIGEQPLKGLAGDRESCRRMARLAVAEALTNLVWVRIPSLESVKASGNWMWAAKLEGEGPKMYDTAEALSDIMVELGICIDGGKDSLSMAARVPTAGGGSETAKGPGQLVITAYAPVPDVRIKVTPDLKTHGDGVLLFVDLGSGTGALGGSALAQVLGQASAGDPPDVDVKALAAAFEATQRLLDGGLLAAGHDRSDGGLIVAVLEMAFAGRCGISLRLDAPAAVGTVFDSLFGEAPGLVYEVRRADLPAVWRILDAQGVRAVEIGETRADSRVVVRVGREHVLDAEVAALHDVWEATSFQLERQQCAIPCVEEEEASFRQRRAPPFELTFTPEPTPQAALGTARDHRVAIIRQEGSNGDREMAASFYLAGFEAWDVHMSDLLEGRTSLDRFRGVAFVGGFSYADTLDSAKGWAGSVLFNPVLAAQFQEFRKRSDSFSLGVCNGCQLLALLGWVPGAQEGNSDAAALPLERQPRFVHNQSGRFESRFSTVRIERSAASKVWLRGMEGSKLGVWVAHGEGRCHFPDAAVYETVQRHQLVPMRYVDDDGAPTQKYPLNPNGSPDAIVGLCSLDGRHLAMMPHPERLTVWPWQWPYAPQSWLEGPERLRASPWLRLFQNVRAWCDMVPSDQVESEVGSDTSWQMVTSESEMKAKIRESMAFTLPECPMEGLGERKTGKVRDIYLSGEKVVMVTNDRVSAFDHILPNLIPFKGQVLNMLSEWSMSQTLDIVPNALVSSPDYNVVVQKKMQNLNVEWIVRGYLWGSMAATYERGDRVFCGHQVPEGLLRFQKFDEPLFTPTTKAEEGHDENMTYKQVEELIGSQLAQEARQAALKLYQRGAELMRACGLILLDTKYEFGINADGKLHVIDEVNTPDSSRLCDVKEWQAKYPKIVAEMASRKYTTVTDLLKAKPELKIKELSKQYVRDCLLESGFDPVKDQAAPKLSEEQVVECAYRYISTYQRITGLRFKFPDTAVAPSKRIRANLQKAGWLPAADPAAKPARAPGALKVLVGEIAKGFQKEIQQAVAGMASAPKLVGFLANKDPAARKYAEWTGRAFQRDGLCFELREVEEQRLEEELEAANKDSGVHGIMIYYPVFGARPSFHGPSQDDVLRDSVSLVKDVEGLCHFYRRSLYRNQRFIDGSCVSKCVLPCTPLAVIKILEHLDVHDKSLPEGDRMSRRTAVVINRSEVVGRPLAAMMANDGATVYSVDVDSAYIFQRGKLPLACDMAGVEDMVRAADVVILGVPSDKYKLDASWVKEGAVVVNVASHKNIDEEALLSTRPGVRFVGQVGQVTVAMLERNLLRLHSNFAGASAAGLGADAAMVSLSAGPMAPLATGPAAAPAQPAEGSQPWMLEPCELELSELAAVSPIDGRYRRSTKQLAGYFSEYGLIRYRVHVEVEYFLALMEQLPVGADLPAGAAERLRAIPAGLTMEQAGQIKATERITNHDVKAVEYFIKERFDVLGLQRFKEYVHFALTSQDVNNTAVPLLIKNSLEACYLPGLEGLVEALRQRLPEWDMPMLARTHGQPASPTNLAKEFKVFIERLEKQLALLRQVPHSCKFGGATGNMNAHLVTYPNIEWRGFANHFCEARLGLARQQFTTQIEHYDNMGAIFDAMKRINTILVDLCRDVWMYVSSEYFKQKIVAGEIGSSAMPHKVNPIDFENAEGNLGVANAAFEHLAQKLPISRLQRDLTDSTVLRNVGVPFAHTMIALSSIQRGLGKLLVNKAAIDADLESNWAVVAEALQSILRRENYPSPYEALKALTRTNEAMSQERIHAFIDGLDVSAELKAELKAVSPFSYVGYS